MTHICIGNLTSVGSESGLSPGRLQAIISTNAGILLIGPLGTNFNEISVEIHTFSYDKMSSAKWRLFRLGPNVLMGCPFSDLWAEECCHSLNAFCSTVNSMSYYHAYCWPNQIQSQVSACMSMFQVDE